VCGAGFGSCAQSGRCEVGEGEGLNGVVEGSRYGGVVVGGDVDGEVEERSAVGLDEGGEAAT